MFNETALPCPGMRTAFVLVLISRPVTETWLLLDFPFFHYFFLACDCAGQHFAVFWLICCALFLLTDALPLHFVKLKRLTEVNKVCFRVLKISIFSLE